MKIAFTGTSRKLTPKVKGRVFDVVMKLAMTYKIFPGKPECFIFGGAIGVDTWALEACKKYFPSVRRIVILPGVMFDQPFYARKIIKECINAQNDELIEIGGRLSAPYKGSGYQIRNQMMVDMSTDVIAFWTGSFRSGTRSTMVMAEKQNKLLDTIKV